MLTIRAVKILGTVAVPTERQLPWGQTMQAVRPCVDVISSVSFQFSHITSSACNALEDLVSTLSIPIKQNKQTTWPVSAIKLYYTIPPVVGEVSVNYCG
jgi:hypothetical protein